MKLNNEIVIEDFLKAVRSCRGGVYLRSGYGDLYNLKSVLSQYIAIGALLGAHGDELELFCDLPEDENNFYRFFHEHPEVL